MSSADINGTNHHRTAIENTVRRGKKQRVFNRLLSGVVRGLSLGMQTDAIRGTLRRSSDAEVAERVRDIGVWNLAVSRAESMLALKGLEGGTGVLLERNARRLVANVLSEVGKKGLAGAGEKEKNGGEKDTPVSGGGQRKDESLERAVLALVGKHVLNDIVAQGYDTTVISKMRWAQEYGTSRKTLRASLAWNETAGFIGSTGTTAVGASRYRLKKVVDTEVAAKLVDVTENVIGIAGGEASGVDRSPFKSDDLDALLSEVEDLELYDDIRARRAERIAAGELSGANLLTDALTRTWAPNGLLKGLDTAIASQIVAEILWSVDSVIWRNSFTGQARGLTWGSWLAMLAGAAGQDAMALGVPAIKLRKPGQTLSHFPQLVERLNAGESFLDIVAEMESAWALARREQKLESWREVSAAKTAERKTFLARRELAATDAAFVLATVGVEVPRSSVPVKVLRAWVQSSFAVVWALELQPEEMRLIARNFAVRLAARRHTPETTTSIVAAIFGKAAAA